MKESCNVCFVKGGNLAAILKKVNELREEFNSLEYKDIIISNGGNGDIRLSFFYKEEESHIDDNQQYQSPVENKLNKLMHLARRHEYYKGLDCEPSNGDLVRKEELDKYLKELIAEFSK